MANRLTTVDLDLNFGVHPVSGDVSKVTGENAIERCLKNLVLLNSYEKPFHPEISGNIRSLLFELEDPFIQVDIRDRLQALIRDYEPRVTIKQVQAVSEPDKNSLDVRIYFSIGPGDIVRTTTVSLERIR